MKRSPEELMNTAIKKGNLKAAFRHLESFKEIDPTDSSRNWYLGICLWLAVLRCNHSHWQNRGLDYLPLAKAMIAKGITAPQSTMKHYEPEHTEFYNSLIRKQKLEAL